MNCLNINSHSVQKKRSHKIEKFKTSTLSNILVTTDVMARGIDFLVNYVVQVGVPINGDTYVHRAGRTARADKSGEAFILVDKKEVNRWTDISDNIAQASPLRKVLKFVPTNKLIEEMQPKMENLEWIRRNTETKTSLKQEKIDEEDANNLGVDIEDTATRKKYDLDHEEKELVRHEVKQRVASLKAENHYKTPDRNESLKWRKNKLVMTP
jgi:superfamily II DNA/RNA helicase